MVRFATFLPQDLFWERTIAFGLMPRQPQDYGNATFVETSMNLVGPPSIFFLRAQASNRMIPEKGRAKSPQHGTTEQLQQMLRSLISIGEKQARPPSRLNGRERERGCDAGFFSR